MLPPSLSALAAGVCHEGGDAVFPVPPSLPPSRPRVEVSEVQTVGGVYVKPRNTKMEAAEIEGMLI